MTGRRGGPEPPVCGAGLLSASFERPQLVTSQAAREAARATAVAGLGGDSGESQQAAKTTNGGKRQRHQTVMIISHARRVSATAGREAGLAGRLAQGSDRALDPPPDGLSGRGGGPATARAAAGASAAAARYWKRATVSTTPSWTRRPLSRGRVSPEAGALPFRPRRMGEDGIPQP